MQKYSQCKYQQCILYLFIIVLLSACFGQTKTKTKFSVYRSSVWENVDLHGTEKNMLGFTEDLLFEIAEQEKIKVQLYTERPEIGLSFLDRPGVDGILTTDTPSIRNEKEYLFSEPFFTYGSVLILRQDSTLDYFKKMKVKVIGFVRGLGNTLVTRDDLGYIFRPYDQVVTAIEDLLEGRVDALVLDSIYASQLASGIYRGRIQVASPLFKVVEFRLAVKKGENEALVALFNDGLKRIKDDSLYKKMLEYWGLSYPPGLNNQKS